MKKALLALFLFAAFAQATGQKISQMTIYLNQNDSALVPVVINGANRTMYAIDIARSVKLKLLVNTNYLDVDPVDSSLILVNSGVAAGTYNNITSITIDAKGRVTAITGTSSNTTPATPSGPVTDDDANTFNWTNSSGYTSISDYEYTVNGGSSYSTVTVKPLLVGDVAKAAGQVGVRVKAATGRNASATLYNTIAFSVASGGGGPGTVSDAVIAEMHGDLVEESAGSKTYSSTAGATWIRSNESIPSGADGIFWQEVSTNTTAIIGIDVDNTLESWYTSQINYSFSFTLYPDFGGEVRYAKSTDANFQISTGMPLPASGQFIGVGREDGKIKIFKSTDGLSTHSTLYEFDGVIPPGILYPKVSFNSGNRLVHPKIQVF